MITSVALLMYISWVFCVQDTIAKTAKAASTDSRGWACLPQSAPTVQAQVSSTVAGRAGCQLDEPSCPQQQQHNGGGDDAEERQQQQRCISPTLACDSWDAQGAQAGPPVAPAAAAAPAADTSVIASLSCPNRPSCPNPRAPIDAGNSNLNSNNKMQSVNVNISTNKGNDNRLLIVCNTAVTVPNTTLQRNTDGLVRGPNNNSSKLDVVDVIDKNYGALIRFSMEPPSQCRWNQIPGCDIPQGHHPNKSDYVTYNDPEMTSDGCPAETGPACTMAQDGYVSLDRLIALCKKTRELTAAGLVPRRLLGLYGGGEGSLSTGTTGWGTPPNTNSNNNNGKSPTHPSSYLLVHSTG